MSTRSRRSGTGGDGGSLNPATIQFLDRGRLVKELELRGLTTVGAKSVLADRLYEFVVNGVRDEPTQNEDVKPELLPIPSKEIEPEEPFKTPTNQGKKRKKNDSKDENVDQEASNVSENEPISTKPKRTRKSTTKAQLIVKEERVKEVEPSVNPFMAFLQQREVENAVETVQIPIKEEIPESEPEQSTSTTQIQQEEISLLESAETEKRPKRNRIARVIATPPPEEPRRRSKQAPPSDSAPKQVRSPVKPNKTTVAETILVIEPKVDEPEPSELSVRPPIDDVFDDGLSSSDEEASNPQNILDSRRKASNDRDYVPEKKIQDEKNPKRDLDLKKKEKEAREAAKLEKRLKEKERERKRLEKEKEKEREKPKNIPITLQWAQVRAQLQKQQQDAKAIAALAAVTTPKPNDSEKTIPKDERGSKDLPKKHKSLGTEARGQAQAQARENVLDSILGDQQQFMKSWEKKDKPFDTTPDKMKAKLLEEQNKQAKLLEEKNKKMVQERRERLSSTRISTNAFTDSMPFDSMDPEKIPIPPPQPQLIIPPRPKTLPPSSLPKPSPSTSSTPDPQPVRLVPPPPPPKLKPVIAVPPPPSRVPPPPSTQSKLLTRIPPPPPPRPNLLKEIPQPPVLREILPEIESPDPESSLDLDEPEFEIVNSSNAQLSNEPSIADKFVEVLKELREQRDVEECVMDMIDFVCSMDVVNKPKAAVAQKTPEDLPNNNENGSTDQSLENSESISEMENDNSSTSSTPIEEIQVIQDSPIQVQDKSLEETSKLPKPKENEQRRPSMDVNLLSDPALLSKMLKTANAVLTSFQKPAEPKQEEVYAQEMPNEEELEASVVEEERPLPEFHGEPVPSDDDDALFEAAAGIPPSKRTKKKKRGEEEVEEETLPPQEAFQLDYYNADLHVKCDSDKERERWWIVHPDNSDGLALMWGGVKTTFGLPLPYDYEFPERPKRRGAADIEIVSSTINGATKENVKPRRLAFQIKILENLSIKHVPFEETEPHEVRIGFALGTSPNILGESARTWCLCSSGKKASNNVFTDWGRAAFAVGDVVTAEFDLDAQAISFWVNGEERGEAFSNLSFEDGDVIFPALSAKNCKIAVNLGNYPDRSEDWGKIDPLWTFPAWLDVRTLFRAKTPPESKGDCTVLMMVGLPGVGKTTWVRHYLRDHHEEAWTLISADTILNQMKVNGVPRSRVHRGRWDMVMGLAAKSVNRYITFACRRRRNYIIDATNCGRESRKRKLTNFKDFRRKCAVIMPTDEEWQGRLARQARQDAKAIMPVECMLELKATLAIPNPEIEPLEEVHFIEPKADFLQQAVDLVQRYNEEARPWLQNQQRSKRRRGYVQQNDGRNHSNNSYEPSRHSWSGLMSSLQAFSHSHQTSQASPVTGPLKLTITDWGMPSPQLSASTPTVAGPDPFAASTALASGKSISTPSVVASTPIQQSTPTTLPPLSVSTDTPTTPSTPVASKSAEAIAAAAVKYFRPAGIPRSQLAKLSKQREDAIMGFHSSNEPQDAQPPTTPSTRPNISICSPIPTIGSQPSPAGLVTQARPTTPVKSTPAVQQTGPQSTTPSVTTTQSAVVGTPVTTTPSTSAMVVPTTLPDFTQPPPLMFGASPQGTAMSNGIVDFSMPPPSFGMSMPGTPTARPMASPLPGVQTPQQITNAQQSQYPGVLPDFTQPPPAPSWPNTFQQPPFY